MIKKWLDKPVTWRGYFKLCGICSLISTIYAIYIWVKAGLIDLDWIKKKLPRKEETED
jgi:hypothetical protein